MCTIYFNKNEITVLLWAFIINTFEGKTDGW